MTAGPGVGGMRLGSMQAIVVDQARRALRAPLPEGEGGYAERTGRLEASLAALLDLVDTGAWQTGPETERLLGGPDAAASS